MTNPEVTACGWWATDAAYQFVGTALTSVVVVVLVMWMLSLPDDLDQVDAQTAIVVSIIVAVATLLAWPVVFPLFVALLAGNLLYRVVRGIRSPFSWFTKRVEAYEARKEKETLLALNAANIDVDKLAKLMERDRA